MDSIYLTFLQILFEKNAQYVVVGGIAANLYGCERMTRDIDIILDLDDAKTMDAFFYACKSLSLVPHVPVKLEDFGVKAIRNKWIKEKNMLVFCLTLHDNPFIKIDIFVKKPDNFEELYKNRKIIEVENQGRVLKLNLVSIDELIKMKEAVGRDKDLIDVNNLKKAKEYD